MIRRGERLFRLVAVALLLRPAVALGQTTAETAVPDAAAPPSLPTGGDGALPDPGAAINVAAQVRLAVEETLLVLPQAPAAIRAAVLTAGGGSGEWLLAAALLAAAAFGVGAALAFAVRRWGGSVLATLDRRTVPVPAHRISHAMLRTGLALAAAASFLVGGAAFVILVVPHPGPARMTSVAVLSAVTYFLVMRDLAVSLFLPHRPDQRLLALDDAAARRMLRNAVVVVAVCAAMLGGTAWIGGLGVAEQVHDVVRIIASVVAVVLVLGYLVAHHRQVSAMVRGAAGRSSVVRRVIAATWLPLVSVYLAVATALNVSNIAMYEGFRPGPIIAPIGAAALGLSLYGLAVIGLARHFAAHTGALAAGARAPAGEPEPAADADLQPVTVWRLRWHALFQRLAGIGAFLVAAATFAAMVSGASVVGEAEAIGLALVLFAAYAVHRTVRTWIDGKIEEELGAAAPGESEEGMGPGSSRLATLLPLLRNVMMVAIFAIAAMVVLSAMGVDVAPLFAGAGVAGLAIGFGAQALIRDIFSGAFFLIDDAFRRGEYIDAGGVTGTVEKISLRSFQLRHHNGPLHTIPFGEIKQLTNYSRDWVIMKLKLRIAYGTDIERVRKLVKKLGQELAADPETGPLFLDALKSQGVVEMEDSAMILRVKFMTRPGDQFVARRHVFTRIGELFEQEGIRFAHREVAVRIAIGRPYQCGSTGRNKGMFVEGVLSIVRTGAPRRDLPEVFGQWNSVFRRFSRWSAKGVWSRIFATMADNGDFEYLILDSTIVRAHQHASGAKGGSQSGDRALAWRAEHEDPPRRARARMPSPHRAHRGSVGRCTGGRTPHGGRPGRGRHRRHRL